MDNLSPAQERADQILAFRAESDELKRAGLLPLSEAQDAEINSYHQKLLQQLRDRENVDLSAQAKHLSLGVAIVSFLGAAALAASLFFLFYQYWGYFTTSQQLIVLVSAPLLMLGVALAVRLRDAIGHYGRLLATLSFASFVLQVVMLGGIFNMQPSPNALALYAGYGFLLAYLFRGKLLLALAIGSSLAFVGAKIGTWMGGYWIYFGQRPEHFLLPAMAFFVLPLILHRHQFREFRLLYQTLAAISIFVALLILSNWGEASYLPWDNELIEGLYQLLGFVSAGLLVDYGLRTQQSRLMLTGSVFFALFLFTKFFDWWWDWLPKYLFFFLIALTAILVMMIFNRLRHWRQDGRP